MCDADVKNIRKAVETINNLSVFRVDDEDKWINVCVEAFKKGKEKHVPVILSCEQLLTASGKDELPEIKSGRGWILYCGDILMGYTFLANAMDIYYNYGKEYVGYDIGTAISSIFSWKN